MSSSAVRQALESYFKSLNTISEKIVTDLQLACEGEEWGLFPNEEQSILQWRKCVDPCLEDKYRTASDETGITSSFPVLVRESGEKLIIDEDTSNGRPFGSSWKDEHSYPFFWETKSQLNLHLLASESSDNTDGQLSTPKTPPSARSFRKLPTPKVTPQPSPKPSPALTRKSIKIPKEPVTLPSAKLTATSPTPQPTSILPVPQPAERQQGVAQPPVTIPVAHPPVTVPVPQPSATIPVPQPPATIPVPQPSLSLPVPQPAATSVPHLAATLPVPRPAVTLPVPRQAATLPVAQSAATLPVPQPKVTKSPSTEKTEKVKRPKGPAPPPPPPKVNVCQTPKEEIVVREKPKESATLPENRGEETVSSECDKDVESLSSQTDLETPTNAIPKTGFDFLDNW